MRYRGKENHIPRTFWGPAVAAFFSAPHRRDTKEQMPSFYASL